MKIRLELGETREDSICGCCGEALKNAHGYLYEDEEPAAVYFALWTEKHRRVDLAIGRAQWADEPPPEEVTAVAIQAWNSGTFVEFAIVTPEASAWAHLKMFGTFLTREDALKRPNIEAFFHLADHVVIEDPRVRYALGG